MASVKLLINTFAKVGQFHHNIEVLQGDFVLKQGIYTINAKSILGIYSLDLSQPVELETNSTEDPETIRQAISDFLCPEEEAK